jgi:hypothetical protein
VGRRQDGLYVPFLAAQFDLMRSDDCTLQLFGGNVLATQIRAAQDQFKMRKAEAYSPPSEDADD